MQRNFIYNISMLVTYALGPRGACVYNARLRSDEANGSAYFSCWRLGFRQSRPLFHGLLFLR